MVRGLVAAMLSALPSVGLSANLLPRDTSFETPGGWYARISERPLPGDAMAPLSNRPVRDPSVAVHGGGSLRMRKLLPDDLMRVEFARVRLDAPGGHVLSAWVRASAEGTPLRMSLLDPSREGAEALVFAGPDWGRVEIMVPGDVAPGAFQAAFEVGQSTATVWLDAVMLSERSMEGYIPAEPLIVGGWLPQAERGYALQGEMIFGDFGVHNATGSRDWVTVHYELDDVFGGWHDSAYNTIDIEANEASHLQLRLGRLPRGWYDLRVVARTRGGVFGGYRTQFAVISDLSGRDASGAYRWAPGTPPSRPSEVLNLAPVGIALPEMVEGDEETPAPVVLETAEDAERLAEALRTGAVEQEPAAASVLYRFVPGSASPESWADLGFGKAYAMFRDAARDRGIELVLEDAGTWWDDAASPTDLAYWVSRKGLLDAVWEVASWDLPGLVPGGWARIDEGTPERVVPPVVVVLNALADVLSGKTLAGVLPTPDGVTALIFRGERSNMLAFWKREDAPPYVIALPATTLPREVTTCVGAPLRDKSVPQEVEIAVTGQPRLVFAPAEDWGSFRGELRASRFRRGGPGRLRSR